MSTMPNTTKVLPERERTFLVNGLQISALEWGSEDGEPVIALHGWLDNAATFSHLCPLLEGLHIIAVDMAGHGRSAPRLGVGAYSFWDDVHDLMVLVDQLGWKTFSLIGHSRGAIISAIAAACFPERIKKLLLIEGLASQPVDPEKTVEQLTSSINYLINIPRKPKRVYRDVESAVLARMNGLFSLSEFAARPLTLRGLKPVDDGYVWASDERLMAPSPIKLSQDQILSFLKSIECDNLLIMGDEGLPKLFPQTLDLLSLIPHISYRILKGGHHLHLESQYPSVAAEVNSFFNVDKSLC